MIFTKDTKVYKLERLLLTHMDKEIPFSFLDGFTEKLTFHQLLSNKIFRSVYKLVEIVDVEVNDYLVVPIVEKGVVYYKYAKVLNIDKHKRIPEKTFLDLTVKETKGKEHLVQGIHENIKFLTKTTTSYSYLSPIQAGNYAHLVSINGYYLLDKIHKKETKKDITTIELVGSFVDGLVIVKDGLTFLVK